MEKGWAPCIEVVAPILRRTSWARFNTSLNAPYSLLRSMGWAPVVIESICS